MRWEKRQEKIEERVYESIDEIAEELDLNVPYYPEVYWVGKKLKFKDLCIDRSYKEAFEDARIGASRIVDYDSTKIILIGVANTIHTSEEASHFVHMVNSRYSPRKHGEIRDVKDFLGRRIMVETLGFFGSKLIVPKRKGEHIWARDFFPLYSDIKKNADLINEIIQSKDEDYIEFFIYQQAEILGQKIFDAYLSGELQKREVRRLFLNPFEEKFSGLYKFIQLKYEWSLPESNR